MSPAERIQFAAHFGLFMLIAGGIGLFSGTTIGRSGILRRTERPADFYITCICHLAVGAFCYLGQFLVQTSSQ